MPRGDADPVGWTVERQRSLRSMDRDDEDGCQRPSPDDATRATARLSAAMATATKETAMVAYLLLTGLVAVACSVVNSLSLVLLAGLTSFQLFSNENKTTAARHRQSVEGVETSNAAKKRKDNSKQKAKETDAEVDESEQLQSLPLQKVTAVAQEFYIPFDKICLFLCIVAANCAAHVFCVLKGWKGNSLLVSLATVSLGITAHAIMRSAYKTRTLNVMESILSIPSVTFTGIIAYYVLLCLPESWNNFRLKEAVEKASPTIQDYFESRGFGGDIRVNYTTVAGALSAMAGVVSGLLLIPATRTMRCYLLAVNPPAWGKELVAARGLKRVLLHVSVLAPFYTTALLIEPLGQALGISTPEWQRTKSVLLIACAILMILPLRQNLQSYLNSALIVWNEAKQGKKLENKLYLEVTKLKLQFKLHSLCAIGVQLLGPALIILIFGAVALVCDPSGLGQAMAALKDKPLLPVDLWYAGASFLGWWAVASWSVFCSAFSLLYMLGHAQL